jgi:hypothetical protein
MPACVLKNLVNVLQLASAAYAVAQSDMENKKKTK